MTRKKKTHCKREHPRTPDNVGNDGSCITCRREVSRKWHKDNLDKHKELNLKWHINNPLRSRALKASTTSGLDKEIVHQYLLERKDVTVCDICQQECPTGNNLALDHDHETNEIRGLLCINCNRGLGSFKDSIKLLEKAADYLREKV